MKTLKTNSTMIKVALLALSFVCYNVANAAKMATSLAGNKLKINEQESISQLNKAQISDENSAVLKNIPNKKRNLAEQLQMLNHNDYGFSIYSAETQLVDDYDADGYFQTFSIHFDADLLTYSIFNRADVYAELYLSFNGGPWQHYLTTDIFTLYGESTEDEYSIHTRLNTGYVTGEYDILIDLYEYGYPDVVASYSGFDDASLAALPLESNEFDPEYVEQSHTDVHVHGGSTSLIMIFVMMFFAALRFKKNR